MDPRGLGEPEPLWRRWLLVLCTLAVGGWIASHAWVGEDAQISFRTIDNFIAGHGLRWNIDERVQSFTHPLWLLLLSALYALTREWFFTVTALGLACSLSAFWMVAWPHRRRPAVLLLVILTPFALSKSLVLFSTSGFENPLSYALFAAFALTLQQGHKEPPWLRLFLIASLAATNRLDTLLLYIPALVVCLLANRRSLRWGRIALGGAPLLAWSSFSLFYFGFLVPNTAPAKLSAELSSVWYLERGLAWALALFRYDLASGLILSLGLLVALVGVVRPRIGGTWERSLGPGLLLYSAYVVSIGGDYIVGRFWALPVFGSILLLAARAVPLYRGLGSFPAPARVASVAALLAWALVARPAAGLLLDGLSDEIEPPERLQARARVSLGRDLRWEYSKVARKLDGIGRALRDEASRSPAGHPLAVTRKTIGFVGAAAGRQVIIVDLNALADPLLARMAPRATAREEMKAGHLRRPLPEGYLHFRSTGELERMDPLLRRYYEPLREIVSGPLFSRHRLATLVRFHLGAYDEWLERYEARGRVPIGGFGDTQAGVRPGARTVEVGRLADEPRCGLRETPSLPRPPLTPWLRMRLVDPVSTYASYGIVYRVRSRRQEARIRYRGTGRLLARSEASARGQVGGARRIKIVSSSTGPGSDSDSGTRELLRAPHGRMMYMRMYIRRASRGQAAFDRGGPQ